MRLLLVKIFKKLFKNKKIQIFSKMIKFMIFFTINYISLLIFDIDYLKLVLGQKFIKKLYF